LLAAVLLNYEDTLRMPSPGGDLELLSGEAEPNRFYIVPAGLQARPEDEVLRADSLAGCPEPDRSQGPAGPPGDPEVVCSGAITFHWLSPSEVEFSVSESVRVVKHIHEVHGVRVSVVRSP